MAASPISGRVNGPEGFPRSKWFEIFSFLSLVNRPLICYSRLRLRSFETSATMLIISSCSKWRVNSLYSRHNVLTYLQKLLREAKLWSKLHHPNITPFYGICFDLGPPSAPCIICPYFKNGNVAQYLQKNTSADRMELVRHQHLNLLIVSYVPSIGRPGGFRPRIFT